MAFAMKEWLDGEHIPNVEPTRCAAKADVMGCTKERTKEGWGVEPNPLA